MLKKTILINVVSRRCAVSSVQLDTGVSRFSTPMSRCLVAHSLAFQTHRGCVVSCTALDITHAVLFPFVLQKRHLECARTLDQQMSLNLIPASIRMNSLYVSLELASNAISKRTCVSSQTNRRSFRLDGCAWQKREREMVSCGVCFNDWDAEQRAFMGLHLSAS